ncbi:MAG: putative Ig domain-containing protein, partial [Thaumarchaeota archaeon]|nr:putative Ig domain-containing protein [Nitrososphaerota archaeon]
TVSDGAGGTDSEDVTVTVSPRVKAQFSPPPPPINAQPELGHIPDKATDEGVTLRINAEANDPDGGQTITYSTNATSLGATIDGTTGVFSWTPTEARGPGTYRITITATDDGSPALADSRTFGVTVSEVNQPPVLGPIGPRSATVGTPLVIEMSAADPDVPANEFAYAVDAPFGTLSGSTFAWTPDDSYANSSIAVTFTVSDGSGGRDSEYVAIGISASPGSSDSSDARNAPPVVGAVLLNHTVNEHETVTFRVPASDPDADALTFALANGSGSVPRGAVINSTTGVFEWTPGEADAGTHAFDVTVRDANGGAAAASVLITVNEVNDHAPLITYPPPGMAFSNVTVGSAFTLTVNATDGDGDTLSYTRQSPGTIDPGSGVYVWTPQPSDVGSHDIRFTVSDTGGHTSSRSVTVTVVDPAPPAGAAVGGVTSPPPAQAPPKICR